MKVVYGMVCMVGSVGGMRGRGDGFWDEGEGKREKEDGLRYGGCMYYLPRSTHTKKNK